MLAVTLTPPGGRQDVVKTAVLLAATHEAGCVPASVDLDAHLLRSHLHWTPSPRLFLALWGGMAVVDVARAGQAPATLQVALLTLLAGVSSLGQRVYTALAVAGVVWLVVLGFVVNACGELVVTGVADAIRLVVVVAAALAGTAVAR